MGSPTLGGILPLSARGLGGQLEPAIHPGAGAQGVPVRRSKEGARAVAEGWAGGQSVDLEVAVDAADEDVGGGVGDGAGGPPTAAAEERHVAKVERRHQQPCHRGHASTGGLSEG